MENAILKALNAESVAEGFDAISHDNSIVVVLDGHVVATIIPSRQGYYDRLYAFPSQTAIGPFPNRDGLRRRICSVVFGGDETAMNRSEIVRMDNNEVNRRCWLHRRELLRAN